MALIADKLPTRREQLGEAFGYKPVPFVVAIVIACIGATTAAIARDTMDFVRAEKALAQIELDLIGERCVVLCVCV